MSDIYRDGKRCADEAISRLERQAFDVAGYLRRQYLYVAVWAGVSVVNLLAAGLQWSRGQPFGVTSLLAAAMICGHRAWLERPDHEYVRNRVAIEMQALATLDQLQMEMRARMPSEKEADNDE